MKRTWKKKVSCAAALTLVWTLAWSPAAAHGHQVENHHRSQNGSGYTSGWNCRDGHWYLCDSTGTPRTGWQQDGSCWYYLGEDGVMQTGWHHQNGHWYHFQQSGAMTTGWHQEDGCWYYLRQDGVMQTGWHQEHDCWYYLRENGVMAIGWHQIGGSWYYFEENGEMATGFLHDGKDWYFLDSTGRWTEDDPETHTALSDTGKTMTLRDGVLYVDGILVANKSYPIPADYAPGGLTAETQAAFNRIQQAMQQEGMSLWVASGYRSYSYQQQLYRNYVARDGQAAADRYSARAGYSEHQTGLAFDVNQVNDSFAATPQAKWLASHAHEYGFIIRYPKGMEGVTGYQYEPWHLRYVGVETAIAVYKSGLCLEQYLGIDSYYHN